jgi:transposase
MDKKPTLFVGVDWASKEHQVCTIGTGEPQQRAFPRDADGLGAMVAWLLDQAPASEIAIAIETPHGPVVEALMDRGVAVFAINPKQLDRFRDRFSPAGAKDDRRDALVLASSLKTDRHCFRRLETLDPLIVELREWSRMTDALKDERTRLTNRIRQQLWRYFPQALERTDDLGAEWFLDILALAPTPSVTAKLTVNKLARILSAQRIRRLSADDALAQLRRPALTVAAGTAEAASAHVLKMAERVRLVNRQIKDATRRLDALTAAIAGPEPDKDAAPGQPVEQHDATILRSLPGVGRPISGPLASPRCSRRRDTPSKDETITLCAPCAASPTGSWRWPAPCSKAEPPMIPAGKAWSWPRKNRLDHWWGVPPLRAAKGL